MLPPAWRAVTLFNPVVYLISGFRWSFYGKGDVDVALSFGIILAILACCLALAAWMIRTGWRMRH
jgi:ABC-2 type transport system permease protein